jgi:Tol biopolymer transport system component
MDWSADGRWLLLMAFDEKKREGAYAVDARTGEARTLAQAESKQTIFTPEWFPDGKAIAYYRRDETTPHSHLIVHDLESGAERELQYGSGDSGYIANAVSPDGRYLAFKRDPEVVGVVAVSGGAPRELFRLDAPDGEIHLAGWSPDSRHVLFETSRNIGLREVDRQMWRIPLEGGERTRLESLISDVPRGSFQFHPDGRRIAFAARQGSGWEIWALENFLTAATEK